MQTYQYDSLYRLTNANEIAGTTQTENWSEKFEYDRYGNRTKKFRDGVEIANNALSYPSINSNTNRFTSNDYGYDKVGNLVTDAEDRSFTFDGNNKQILVTDVNNQAVGEYFYDGDGKRVKKKIFTGGVHSKTVIFVYSGGKLIEEYATDPPTNPKTKYLTEDHLGTPRVITDGNGQVVSRRDFMPFGEQIANTTGTRSDNSFKYSSNEDDVQQKFTGYQKDGETMLDFAEARMYENRHARFTAVDPLLASGKNSNPQTFNRYVYVGNNPINITDPLGLDWYYRYENGRGSREWFDSDPGGKWKRLTGAMGDLAFTCFCTLNGQGEQAWRSFDPLSNTIYSGPNGEGFASQDDAADAIRGRRQALRFRDVGTAIIDLNNVFGYSANDLFEVVSGRDFTDENSPDYIASELTGDVATTIAGGVGVVKGGLVAAGKTKTVKSVKNALTDLYIHFSKTRTINNYSLTGYFVKIGKTYNINVWNMDGLKEVVRAGKESKWVGDGLTKLIKSLEKEAIESGASRVNFLGSHVVNPRLLSPKVLRKIADKADYKYKQLKKDTFLLYKQLK